MSGQEFNDEAGRYTGMIHSPECSIECECAYGMAKRIQRDIENYLMFGDTKPKKKQYFTGISQFLESKAKERMGS